MSTGVKAHVAGSCGCKAGWFEMFPRLSTGDVRQWQVGFMAIQAVDWFVPEHHLSIGLRCLVQKGWEN